METEKYKLNIYTFDVNCLSIKIKLKNTFI